MNPNHHVSDEHLNAFIDNQLDSSERIEVFDSIRHSDSLRERVCEISGLKEMMQHAYPLPTAPKSKVFNHYLLINKTVQAMAASLLIMIGGISGWYAHSWSALENPQEITNIVQQSFPADSINNTRKLIVHVNNSNTMKINAALEETEILLESYKQKHLPIQVELIANKSGVDLFRSKVSAYEKRLSLLQNKYPNLKMIVCGTTIGKLKSKGEEIQLLPHVDITPSAADKIHNRIEQGWGYTRI